MIKITEQDKSRINEIFAAYRMILDFENRKVNFTNYYAFISKYLNTEIQVCKTCAASIKRFHSDFQTRVFTDLYREYPFLVERFDDELMKGTPYAGNAKTSLLTASIETHQTLINKFKNDQSAKKTNFSIDRFKEMYNELIDLLKRKVNYFKGTIYSSYIESIHPIKFVKIEPIKELVEHIEFTQENVTIVQPINDDSNQEITDTLKIESSPSRPKKNKKSTDKT